MFCVCKKSRHRGRRYVMEHTMQNSSILDSIENYETEIEVKKKKMNCRFR